MNTEHSFQPPIPSALILGRGYVAKALLAFHSLGFCVTSRKGTTQGNGSFEQPKYFDLDDPGSWSVVESFEQIVWTFPAAQKDAEIEKSLRFFESKCLQKKRVLILASTSAYRVNTVGALVDEKFPLDFNQPRVRAEEDLRDRGACVLHLAGIYGTGRDPVSWLQRGLIKNPDSFINLIHISDICHIMMRWLYSDGLSGRRLNASDGRHRTWNKLIEDLKRASLLDARFELTPDLGSPQGTSSKRICNEVLLKELYSGPFHSYPEEGLG
ncbi:MAG: hypothetical protein RJB13_2055 [Pseudomonadota bacterium]